MDAEKDTVGENRKDPEEKKEYRKPKLHIHGNIKTSANEVTTVTYYY